MKDLKKMFKMTLYPSKFYSVVLFCIYLGFLILNVSATILHPEMVHESGLLKIVLCCCLVTQMFLITALPYDKIVLSTMPIQKIHLYPVVLICLYFMFNIIYISTFLLYEWFLDLPLSLNLCYIFTSISIMAVLFKMAHFENKNGTFSNGFMNFILYLLINPLLGLSIRFLDRTSYFLGSTIFILAFYVLIVFLNWGWIKEKKSKKRRNTFKGRLRYKSSLEKNLNSINIVNKLKWSSLSPFSILIFIVYISLNGLDYITSGLNYNVLFITMAILTFYENGFAPLALIGLPITPKQIYLTCVRTKFKIVVSILVVSMLADILFNGLVMPQTYLANVMWIIIVLLCNELFYSVYRLKNFSYPLMALILILNRHVSIKVDNLLGLSFIIILLLLAIAFLIKANLNIINSEKIDLTGMLEQKNL